MGDNSVLQQSHKFTIKANVANIGNNVFTAIPSNGERKPNPKADANEPSAGKHAVQLRAANQAPPEPILSKVLFNILGFYF